MTLTLEVEDRLDEVLVIVAGRLMIDLEWITNPAHARRPQAAFARRMFIFVCHYYAHATQRQIASFLDVDDRTVARLLNGYRDADGNLQPGALALIQSDVKWYELALQIREEIQNA